MIMHEISKYIMAATKLTSYSWVVLVVMCAVCPACAAPYRVHCEQCAGGTRSTGKEGLRTRTKLRAPDERDDDYKEEGGGGCSGA